METTTVSPDRDDYLAPIGTPPSHPRLLNLMLKSTPVSVGAAVAAGCVFVASRNPETHHVFPQCGFYLLTGFYCPGCGATRAAYNVMHGNFLRAFEFNALFTVSVPLFLYFFTWWVVWTYTGRRMPVLTMSKKLTWAVFGLIALFIVGRNFPGAIPAFFARDRV